MKFARRFLYLLVMLGAAGAYGVFGFFQVEPDEEAVVLRLGAYDRTLAKGPHWHALGIETVEVRRIVVERERQILAALGNETRKVIEIVRIVYAAYPETLYPAAGQSVTSHLKKLEVEGRVRRAQDAPEGVLESRWRKT